MSLCTCIEPKSLFTILEEVSFVRLHKESDGSEDDAATVQATHAHGIWINRHENLTSTFGIADQGRRANTILFRPKWSMKWINDFIEHISMFLTALTT